MVAALGDHSIQRLLNFNSDEEEDPQDPEVYYQIPESLEEPHPFDFDPPDIQRVNNIRTENSYQYNDANLILSNPAACVKAFNKDGPLGLLYLFLPSRFINKYMLGATQESLNKKEPSRGEKSRLLSTKSDALLVLTLPCHYATR